jgi:hypothetical protein
LKAYPKKKNTKAGDRKVDYFCFTTNSNNYATSHHSNATTNLHIRNEIQNSNESNVALAIRFKTSEKTVSKWKNRDFIQDASCTPLTIKYALSDLERALAISLRKSTWISLDDVWETLMVTNPKIMRASIYQAFVKEGINTVPAEEVRF